MQSSSTSNSGSMRRRALSRRTVLRGAGVVFGLPLLDAMSPAVAARTAEPIPRRMVAIETNMGILPQFFFPEQTGADYALSPYLERLGKHRQQMTVFSGVSLPGVTGGHAAERCFLTGTPHPERGGFRNGVSLDQFAAEQVGSETRFSSLHSQSPTKTPRSATREMVLRFRPKRARESCSSGSSFRGNRKKSKRTLMLFVRDEVCWILSATIQKD